MKKTREREKDHVFACPALAGCGGRTHTASAHHTAKNAHSEERTERRTHRAQDAGAAHGTQRRAELRANAQSAPGSAQCRLLSDPTDRTRVGGRYQKPDLDHWLLRPTCNGHSGPAWIKIPSGPCPYRDYFNLCKMAPPTKA